jgi:hypothetical protein
MAEFEKRLACVIKADDAYMIDSCKFNGVNEYITIWESPLPEAANTNFAAAIDSGMDEDVLPRLITIGLKDDPLQM